MKSEKYVIQFLIKSIPEHLLWTYISSAEGLGQWFAGKVRISDNKYYFEWEGSEQRTATRIASDNESYITFHWDDAPEEETWTLSISVLDLTDDTMLTVTDWSAPEDVEDDKELWASQVEELKRILGC